MEPGRCPIVGALQVRRQGLGPRGFLGPLGAAVEPSALRRTLDLSRSRNASAMASLHEDPGNMFKIGHPGGELIVRAEMPWAGSKWPASVLYSYLRGFPSR